MTERSTNCCNRLCDNAEFLTRSIFCTPRRKRESDDDNDTEDSTEESRYLLLRWVSFVFAIYKLIKFGFDIRVVVGLFQNGFATEGGLLLAGMVLSWVVSSFGQSRADTGGSYWAPFYMSPKKYYESIPRREFILCLLFTITFTEVASFLFEDGAFVNVFARTREVLGNPNTFDRVTLILTLIKALAAVTILLLSFLATLNFRWCKGPQDDSWYTWIETALWANPKPTRFRICCSYILNATKVIVFLAVWLAALGVIGTNVFLVFCLLQPDPSNPENQFSAYESALDFIPSTWHDTLAQSWYPLIVSWVFALYFSVSLIGRKLKSEESYWIPATIFDTSSTSSQKKGWWHR